MCSGCGHGLCHICGYTLGNGFNVKMQNHIEDRKNQHVKEWQQNLKNAKLSVILTINEINEL